MKEGRSNFSKNKNIFIRKTASVQNTARLQ